MKTRAIKALAVIVAIARINDGVVVQAMNRDYKDILTEYIVVDDLVVLESKDGNMFEWYMEEGQHFGDGMKYLATMNDNGTKNREDDTILDLYPLR